jgi:hypothetical protein
MFSQRNTRPDECAANLMNLEVAAFEPASAAFRQMGWLRQLDVFDARYLQG